MIHRSATQVGNPIIRKKSAPVPMKSITSAQTKKLIKDLTDSMRYHGLVGMAAPQIGINTRVFVSEIRKTKFRKPDDLDPLRVFFNPKIVSYSKTMVAGYEGCGSVAASGLFGSVPRPAKVVVEAFDVKGKKFRLSVSGLLARIIQHETDHLNGIIFLDCMTETLSLMSREEYLGKR